jgi:hypothetical protein
LEGLDTTRLRFFWGSDESGQRFPATIDQVRRLADELLASVA